MGGGIRTTCNRLLTATMLVIVLIACQRMPEEQSQNQLPQVKPDYNLTNNSQ